LGGLPKKEKGKYIFWPEKAPDIRKNPQICASA
jgi:hypothetical protein